MEDLITEKTEKEKKKHVQERGEKKQQGRYQLEEKEHTLPDFGLGGHVNYSRTLRRNLQL